MGLFWKCDGSLLGGVKHLRGRRQQCMSLGHGCMLQCVAVCVLQCELQWVLERVL